MHVVKKLALLSLLFVCIRPTGDDIAKYDEDFACRVVADRGLKTEVKIARLYKAASEYKAAKDLSSNRNVIVADDDEEIARISRYLGIQKLTDIKGMPGEKDRIVKAIQKMQNISGSFVNISAAIMDSSNRSLSDRRALLLALAIKTQESKCGAMQRGFDVVSRASSSDLLGAEDLGEGKEVETGADAVESNQDAATSASQNWSYFNPFSWFGK